MIGPQRILPTGCMRYVNDVTTPKFPPPPRIAQNRSGSSVALAFRIRPSAVTISASSRLSQASPCFRIRIPKPPPRVSPAIPVSETIPPVVARPCAWVARSRSRQVAPPSAVAIRPPADELPFQIRRKPFDHALGENHRFPSTDTHGRRCRASISADPACVSRTGMVDSPKYLARDPNRKGGSVQPFPNILTAPPRAWSHERVEPA